jgi:hypothetical protein
VGAIDTPRTMSIAPPDLRCASQFWAEQEQRASVMSE